MYVTYKLTRSAIKSLVSDAAPWQIAVGTACGTLLGFLPMWPVTQGPSPLWFLVLAVAFLISCHLGSLLLFFAIGKLLAKFLLGPAIVIGIGLQDVAKSVADVPFLYWSLLSHTGYLGLTLLGVGFAAAFAVVFTWVTVFFRTKIKARIAENAKLMKAGKLADRPVLFRIACWFLGL